MHSSQKLLVCTTLLPGEISERHFFLEKEMKERKLVTCEANSATAAQQAQGQWPGGGCKAGEVRQ